MIKFKLITLFDIYVVEATSLEEAKRELQKYLDLCKYGDKVL